MIFIKDKLTYEEVRSRFEKEDYKLLSREYKNAKSNLDVMCPQGHEWTTNMSNFGSGRRCSVCSRKKKYTLEEVKCTFAKEGYRVMDSIYINGKTPIKFICPSGHETEVNLNNFMNGRRCNLCNRMKAKEARMKKLELKLKTKVNAPLSEIEIPSVINEKRINDSARQVNLNWLDKVDEMRKNLKLEKSRGSCAKISSVIT